MPVNREIADTPKTRMPLLSAWMALVFAAAAEV
jgi:hypothetical protein